MCSFSTSWKTSGRAFEASARAAKVAGKASEVAGRASKIAGRALKEAEKNAEMEKELEWKNIHKGLQPKRRKYQGKEKEKRL